MNYAIINNDAITAHGRARDLWPGTSFPLTGPNEAFLAEANAVPIRSDLPHDSATEYLKRVDPYLLNGEAWDREVVTRPLPAPEPQWVQFGEDMAFNPAVQGFINALPRTAALLLGVGLGQAGQGDPKTFIQAWNRLRPSIPEELVNLVAGLASDHNLPLSFTQAILPPVASGRRTRSLN